MLPVPEHALPAVNMALPGKRSSYEAPGMMDCNRRLEELRAEIVLFLSQDADDYVYWVQRAGKTQRIIALNAAPIDVAEYLRRPQRVFALVAALSLGSPKMNEPSTCTPRFLNSWRRSASASPARLKSL